MRLLRQQVHSTLNQPKSDVAALLPPRRSFTSMHSCASKVKGRKLINLQNSTPERNWIAAK